MPIKPLSVQHGILHGLLETSPDNMENDLSQRSLPIIQDDGPAPPQSLWTRLRQ